jgi:hypothetical protein
LPEPAESGSRTFAVCFVAKVFPQFFGFVPVQRKKTVSVSPKMKKPWRAVEDGAGLPSGRFGFD